MAGSAAEQFARAGVTAGEAQPRRTAAEIIAQVQGQGAAPAPAAEVEKPAGEDPGLGTAILRGAKQGLTLGFGDEISGALESAFTDKTYKQARDEARANDKAASAAHPYGFGLGQILGGAATALVPVGAVGAGAAKLGAGVAGSIARGAGAGIATGAGESEATSAEGVVQDAAKGGLVGGALGGLGHGLSRILGGAGGIVGGAERRADETLAKDLLEKVPAKTQDRALHHLGGREGLAEMLRGDKALLAAKKAGPAELAAEAAAQKEPKGQAIGALVQTIDKAEPGGVSLPSVTSRLGKLWSEAKAAGDFPRANTIGRELETLNEEWGGRTAIPASDVHKLMQRYGRGGFQGGSFENPSDAKRLGRELWGEVKDALHEHVDQVAKGKGLAEDAARLKALNKDFSKLSALEDLAESQATRAGRNTPSLGERFGHLANIGHAGHIISSPLTGIPTALAVKGGPLAARASTAALASLVRAARSGSVPAELVQNALEMGVPRATVEAVVSAQTAPSVQAHE